MRVTQTVIIIDADGTVSITVLDEQFDGRCDFLRGLDRLLQAIRLIARSIDSDDLSADGYLSGSLPSLPITIPSE
jgi:hypothetical protein